MKVNRIMIVSLLLLAILAIGAASASEDVDTLDVEEVDDLSVDESSDIVTDGESPGTLETVGIYFHSDDSYPITEIDDKHVVDFDMPIDSNGVIVVSSGDKILYNKEYNEIEHKWNNSYTSNDRKGLWINNYEVDYFNGLSDGDIVKFSYISDTSQTYSNYGRILIDGDYFSIKMVFDPHYWEDEWRGTLYLDTSEDIVNIRVFDKEIGGTFYVEVNDREYKYMAYFNEWDDDAWHNWKLSSFDITEAGQYPVAIKYARDDSSPREILRYGILNIFEFANDTFRATMDTHYNLNLFCPDNREGTVSIYMKSNWEDEYKLVLTDDITSDDFNTWKTWNFADFGCEKGNEYIFKMVVSGDSFDSKVVMEDKNQWYNDPWDIYITPEITLEAYDSYFEGGRDDDNNVLGLYIPEKANVYEGTLEIINGETVIYSKDLTTADMDFDDNSRDYRYWLRYKDIKNILVNYDNAALTFSFNYNNTQIIQPLVVVKVINKRNYEIEIERAFSAGIYNADWGESSLYLDYNMNVVNIDVRNPAANGIFYVTANGKEYQYQANFDDEGRDWHSWVLSSFNITEADSYHVTIEYANDASSPRFTVMEGDLNVVEFNNDAFRIMEDRPAQVFNFFCPEGSEGSIISIFREDDWGDENPTNIMNIIIGSENCGEWFNLSFADMGLIWDEENILLIKILDGNTEVINPYETSIWYDYEPYEPFMPSDLVVNINGDDFRSENDEDVVIDLYIPENLMIYRGTVTLTSNGRTIYSKEIALNNLEFDPNGRYYQLKIEFGELNLDGLNSGDVVKFAFTNDVKNLEKSVFYRIHHDEDDEWVNFKLINFIKGNFLDDEVLIEVADFPEGVEDEFVIIVDKWGDEKELTFKISELERNEEGFYVWKCSDLDIADFMEDMTDANIRFVFKFSDGYEIEGESWVYKNPCISSGEVENVQEEPIIHFLYLPDAFEGEYLWITITKDGESVPVYDHAFTREEMDDYYIFDEEDDEYQGWFFGLEDLNLLKQYGTYHISVKMTKNGEAVYYNSTIELVDFTIDARDNLDQITSAVFRILLDDDASGNVVIYVDGTKVFNKTLEWIGYSSWNRMGGFNIPLNYLQITESGDYEITLVVEATDDREQVMTRTINHNIHVEVAPNNIAFGDIIYLYRDNFLYPTSLTSPLPLDAEFILYLNGIEAGRTRIECDDFMFRDLDPSLLDEYGALRPGLYNAEIRQVSEEGNVTYAGSFEVKTRSSDVEVIVPATVTTIDGVNVAVIAPRPDNDKIDSTGLIIFIDPFLNEEGELESEDMREMWGWELVDFLEDNPYIELDSLSAGTHKILVQYFNDGDDGADAIGSPFFSDIFTVNVKKAATQIVASPVTATYKVAKNLVITLKDANGRILAGKRVTVKVGTITKTLTTNGKGQISVDVSSLVPKSYTATITFAGDGAFLASTKAVKVVVNKAKTKLTAKKVKVKVSAKTKKVTAILKFNTNKLLKSKYVTLKINKKTYKVKTNKKGQAIFKVKNLKRKGTFTGTLKFKGDKYFKASSCKVKVTVK